MANLGTAWQVQGDLREAAACLEQAVRLAPGDPQDLVGKTVRRGDPLFLVDNRPLKAQLRYTEANLKSAEAQEKKLEAMPRQEEVPPSEAKVRAAESNVKMQEDLADRASRMIGTRSISEEAELFHRSSRLHHFIRVDY